MRQQSVTDKVKLEEPNISHWYASVHPFFVYFIAYHLHIFISISPYLGSSTKLFNDWLMCHVAPPFPDFWNIFYVAFPYRYVLWTCNRIVRSYLLHYGYQDTLNSFDLANATDPPASRQNGHREPPPEIYGLSHRKLLRQVSFKTRCNCLLNPFSGLLGFISVDSVGTLLKLYRTTLAHFWSSLM